MPHRDKIFVSYSHKDRKLFEEFKIMLAPAIQRGLVDVWGRHGDHARHEVEGEIQKALGSACIAVLLVDPKSGSALLSGAQ